MKQRVLICGDRDWNHYEVILNVLRKVPHVDCVIEGEARGADLLGYLAAAQLGIDVMPFPADWAKYGRAAGPIRNQEMIDKGRPTLVLAFHDDLDHSKGTADMIARARRAGIEVRIFDHDGKTVIWHEPQGLLNERSIA